MKQSVNSDHRGKLESPRGYKAGSTECNGPGQLGRLLPLHSRGSLSMYGHTTLGMSLITIVCPGEMDNMDLLMTLLLFFR